MNVTIISAITLVFLLIFMAMAIIVLYRMFVMIATSLFGISKALDVMDATYRHAVYNTQVSRLMLEELGKKVQERISAAVENEKYELISNYQSMAQAIDKLKEFTDEEIEKNS